MDFKDYKKWFIAIYGLEATEKILDDENECIVKDEEKLLNFFKNYERIESIPDKENGYIIKGCNECISKGLLVRKQDTPGFLGKLNEIKYVIIGLEANIPDDIHIAFSQFETVAKEHQLFTRLKLFFPQIKDKAYVTDIAKCRSTNLDQSRKNCLETHFFKELKMLLEFNPDLQIIFQGTTVEEYFSKSKELKHFSEIHENDEIKSNKGKFLFKRRYLLFDNKKIPIVIFPHGTSQTSNLWKEIEGNEVFSNIKAKLTEFNFN